MIINTFNADSIARFLLHLYGYQSNSGFVQITAITPMCGIWHKHQSSRGNSVDPATWSNATVTQSSFVWLIKIKIAKRSGTVKHHISGTANYPAAITSLELEIKLLTCKEIPCPGFKVNRIIVDEWS